MSFFESFPIPDSAPRLRPPRPAWARPDAVIPGSVPAVTTASPAPQATHSPAPATDGELVSVRAPLPGTFYRAPRPGAEAFVEVGSEVGADTVVGIVETMKLMNSVTAGVSGTVAEFCVGNAEFAPQGAPLLRIRTGLPGVETGS